MGNIQEEEKEEKKGKGFLIASVTLMVLIVMALLVIGYLFISMKKLENEMIETSAFEVGDYPKKVTFSVEYDTEAVDLMIISPSGKTYEAGDYGVVYENTDYSMYDTDSLDNGNNDSDKDNTNAEINNMDSSDSTESKSINTNTSTTESNSANIDTGTTESNSVNSSFTNLNTSNTDTTAATNTMSDTNTNADTNMDTDIAEDNSISTTSGVSELVDSYAEESVTDSALNSTSDNMNNASDSTNNISNASLNSIINTSDSTSTLSNSITDIEGTSDSIINMKGICSITITASEKGEWKVAYNKKSNGTLNPRVDVDYADGVYIYNVTLDTGDTNNTSSNTKNADWQLTLSTMCGSVDELQIVVFAESNKVNKRCMLAEEVIDVNKEVTIDLDTSNLITADDWKITIYTYDTSDSTNSSYHISYKLTEKYSYKE